MSRTLAILALLALTFVPALAQVKSNKVVIEPLTIELISEPNDPHRIYIISCAVRIGVQEYEYIVITDRPEESEEKLKKVCS